MKTIKRGTGDSDVNYVAKDCSGSSVDWSEIDQNSNSWFLSGSKICFGDTELKMYNNDRWFSIDSGDCHWTYKLTNKNEEEVMGEKKYSLYNVIVVDDSEVVLLDTKVVSFSGEGAKVKAGAYSHVEDLDKATILVTRIGDVVTPLAKKAE